MSIQALNWVLSQDALENSGARFVLLILANYANEEGFCYPSRETIARKTSMTSRAVQNHLNWLIAHGYITAENRRSKGKQSTNLYRLKIFADFQGENFSAQSENPSPRNAAQSENFSPAQSENLSPNTSGVNTKEENLNITQTHQHTEAAVAVCENYQNRRVRIRDHKPTGSQFSLSECLRYVNICIGKGEPIQNPKGLASHLYRTGESDPFILAVLYPAENAEREREFYGEPRPFSDEPCTVCFGAKMEIIPNKGARPCEHCRNERGQSTGKEPLNFEL